jgi:hypothetical protein
MVVSIAETALATCSARLGASRSKMALLGSSDATTLTAWSPPAKGPIEAATVLSETA